MPTRNWAPFCSMRGPWKDGLEAINESGMTTAGLKQKGVCVRA